MAVAGRPRLLLLPPSGSCLFLLRVGAAPGPFSAGNSWHGASACIYYPHIYEHFSFPRFAHLGASVVYFSFPRFAQIQFRRFLSIIDNFRVWPCWFRRHYLSFIDNFFARGLLLPSMSCLVFVVYRQFSVCPCWLGRAVFVVYRQFIASLATQARRAVVLNIL